MINLKQKHVKFEHNHIRWIDIQEVVFFHAASVSFFEGTKCNITNGNVTNHEFLVVF